MKSVDISKLVCVCRLAFATVAGHATVKVLITWCNNGGARCTSGNVNVPGGPAVRLAARVGCLSQLHPANSPVEMWGVDATG